MTMRVHPFVLGVIMSYILLDAIQKGWWPGIAMLTGASLYQLYLIAKGQI